jgi:hypothetical protein
MQIAFESLVKDPTIANRLPMEGLIYLKVIKDYIIGRLMPLKDEIDSEEGKSECGIMVRFPVGLGFAGYSAGLRKKMLDSFSNAAIDLQILWDKLDIEIKRLLN